MIKKGLLSVGLFAPPPTPQPVVNTVHGLEKAGIFPLGFPIHLLSWYIPSSADTPSSQAVFPHSVGHSEDSAWLYEL